MFLVLLNLLEIVTIRDNIEYTCFDRLFNNQRYKIEAKEITYNMLTNLEKIGINFKNLSDAKAYALTLIELINPSSNIQPGVRIFKTPVIYKIVDDEITEIYYYEWNTTSVRINSRKS